MSHSHSGKVEEKFSPTLFIFTICATLAGMYGVLWLIAPGIAQSQWQASGWSWAAVILATHVVCGAGEYFFHRYVLHAPLVPFLAYFYKQHTLHHALTRVGYTRGKNGKDENVPCLIENRYPIEEEKQFEASYFPWYTLVGFTALACVVLVPLQWLLPNAPVMVGGFFGIALSVTLYELIHAVEHWPQATWDRLVAHPRFGGFWRKAYAFHLRHHADIRCNEAISGVFGLPVYDFILGTYVDPETLYTHGQQVPTKEFVSPTPRFKVIRWLDRRADEAVKKRRQRRSTAEVS